MTTPSIPFPAIFDTSGVEIPLVSEVEFSSDISGDSLSVTFGNTEDTTERTPIEIPKEITTVPSPFGTESVTWKLLKRRRRRPGFVTRATYLRNNDVSKLYDRLTHELTFQNKLTNLLADSFVFETATIPGRLPESQLDYSKTSAIAYLAWLSRFDRGGIGNIANISYENALEPGALQMSNIRRAGGLLELIEKDLPFAKNYQQGVDILSSYLIGVQQGDNDYRLLQIYDTSEARTLPENEYGDDALTVFDDEYGREIKELEIRVPYDYTTEESTLFAQWPNNKDDYDILVRKPQNTKSLAHVEAILQRERVRQVEVRAACSTLPDLSLRPYDVILFEGEHWSITSATTKYIRNGSEPVTTNLSLRGIPGEGFAKDIR